MDKTWQKQNWKLFILCTAGFIGGCSSNLADIDHGVSNDAGPIDSRATDTTTDAQSTDTHTTNHAVASESGAWCDRALAGVPNNKNPALSLSYAHAAVRFFGVVDSMREADTALVGAINATGGQLNDAAALAYAKQLSDVCYLAAHEVALPAAKVVVKNDIATISPGTGAITIPVSAKALVLDLTQLPIAKGLDAAIDNALSAVLWKVPVVASQSVQKRVGLTDEAFRPESLYNKIAVVQLPIAWPPVRPGVSKPVAVLVGKRLPRSAAERVAFLRAANLIRIIGEPIDISVAESRWVGTVHGGLYVRDRELNIADQRLPDIIPADDVDVTVGVSKLVGSTTVPVLEFGALPNKRPQLKANLVHQDLRTDPLTIGALKAALITAHGAVKLFFPYFNTIQDITDDRLTQTLSAAEKIGTDRFAATNLLRRFGAAIQDGHNWVYDFVAPPQKIIPIVLTRVEGQPVVERSYDAAIKAGEVLVQVRGQPAKQFFDAEMQRTLGATDGNRFFSAANYFTQTDVPLPVRVRAPDGKERDITLNPTTGIKGDLYSGSTRPTGYLTDLNQPNVFYMNCDGAYIPSDAAVATWLSQMQGASGLILDMRGHPASRGGTWDPYSFLTHIIQKSFATGKYRVPVYSGLDQVDDIHPYEQVHQPVATLPYAGPVVLITDYRAVSFAEDFMMMLVGAGRTKHIVGTPSAGTTGSVTGMLLPAGFAFYMTGMEARWPDNKTLFGVGVTPDIPVNWTIKDLSAGTDPFIAAAITALN